MGDAITAALADLDALRAKAEKGRAALHARYGAEPFWAALKAELNQTRKWRDGRHADWRGISPDPTNREATAKMDTFFRDITRVEAISRVEMIENFCRGQQVLDIGAGEHDIAFFSEEGWEHNRIKRVAKKAVAVEINPELCKHYNAKGFDFRCADATSDMDLGERFDRVFCGDVIEHVNDPVGLLNFAKRHLKPEGVMLFTTPNPFAPRFRQHRAQRRTRYVMANLEQHALGLDFQHARARLAGGAGDEGAALADAEAPQAGSGWQASNCWKTSSIGIPASRRCVPRIRVRACAGEAVSHATHRVHGHTQSGEASFLCDEPARNCDGRPAGALRFR